MDALLRFLLYRITWTLLFTELMIMVVCVIAIIIIKLITHWHTRKRVSSQQALSEIFEKVLFDQTAIETLSIPSHLRQFRDLIEVLEKFDQRFTDTRWIEIKNKVVDAYLLARAKTSINSWSWFNRQLAARCYLLSPEKATEMELNTLLNDDRYLVRVVAVVCITKCSFRDLFYEMLKKMSTETRLSQFPYRDALVQMNQEKYDWLEAILRKETDPSVVAICLDILSTRFSKNLLTLIRPYVNAENRECRILAIKALGNIATEESIEILTDHLMDSDWEIRAEAVKVLQKLYATQASPQIRRLLNDPVWWVRLQAALAFKSFGEAGMEILESQEADKDPLAYEISQYALALPSI